MNIRIDKKGMYCYLSPDGNLRRVTTKSSNIVLCEVQCHALVVESDIEIFWRYVGARGLFGSGLVLLKYAKHEKPTKPIVFTLQWL